MLVWGIMKIDSSSGGLAWTYKFPSSIGTWLSIAISNDQSLFFVGANNVVVMYSLSSGSIYKAQTQTSMTTTSIVGFTYTAAIFSDKSVWFPSFTFILLTVIMANGFIIGAIIYTDMIVGWIKKWKERRANKDTETEENRSRKIAPKASIDVSSFDVSIKENKEDIWINDIIEEDNNSPPDTVNLRPTINAHQLLLTLIRRINLKISLRSIQLKRQRLI